MTHPRKLTPDQLAALAYDKAGTIEVDPETGTQHLMVRGVEVAWAVEAVTA